MTLDEEIAQHVQRIRERLKTLAQTTSFLAMWDQYLGLIAEITKDQPELQALAVTEGLTPEILLQYTGAKMREIAESYQIPVVDTQSTLISLAETQKLHAERPDGTFK